MTEKKNTKSKSRSTKKQIDDLNILAPTSYLGFEFRDSTTTGGIYGYCDESTIPSASPSDVTINSWFLSSGNR